MHLCRLERRYGQLISKKCLQRLTLSIFGLGALWYPFSASGGQMNQSRQPSPAGFQPNRAVPGAHYIGSQACAECHTDKVHSQQATPMGHALEMPVVCQVLHSHSKLQFREGSYAYAIERDGDRSIYKVTDGSRTISEPILWAFGQGIMGQTYVFLHDGTYREGRVSFYKQTDGLDITIGHSVSLPRSLDDALGRVMVPDEAQACFGCHSTAAAGPKKLEVDRMIPGVTCESCHGPGENHIAAMKAGNLEEKHIFNPATLGTEDLLNFCGACHRTWEQVALMGLKGVNNVRFQPYRLTNSKCYDADDHRISCLACHDPHDDLKHEPAFYDAKGNACHRQEQSKSFASKRSAATCRVGKQLCVTCHMPKYDLPGGHYRFTDHHIRIVKPNDPYPN